MLVVDDDPAILMLTRAKLEDAGFEVFTCSDALQASLMVQSERPNLLILDVVMPGMAGDRLAQAIAGSRHGESPTIVLHSSLDGEELEGAVSRAGALGAIRKSGDPRYFMFQLREMLNRRTAPPE